MNENLLCDTIEEAVATDSAVDAWCLVNYGASINVNPSVDRDNMAGASQCPLVLVEPVHKIVGNEESEKVHLVDVCVVIYDEEIEPHAAVSNLNIYTGRGNVVALRQLVQDAITDIDLGALVSSPGSVWVRRIESEYLPMEEFGFFGQRMTLEIVEYVTIGGDRLT